MKRKIIFGIILILTFFILLPSNNVMAIESSGGYKIEDYHIDMIVHENNIFDITETITVNFTEPRHGIFLRIPEVNSIKRTDGTFSNNIVVISNIRANYPCDSYHESGDIVIKIGDENKTIIGKQVYVVKYNYDIGKDPLKDEDEFYYNLIGNKVDVTIENFSFNIEMPKPFDTSKMGITSGKYGSTSISNVNYQVVGNTISGNTYTSLNPEEIVTIRIYGLPEDYFVNENYHPDTSVDFAKFAMVLSAIFIVISFVLWVDYGKDDKVVETVEFYSPDGYNSAELNYMYHGGVTTSGVTSLLIHLANKGYVKIIEEGNNSFAIKRLKDYDGDNEVEKIFFRDLFDNKDIARKEDLSKRFSSTVEVITSKLTETYHDKIFEKLSDSKRVYPLIMAIVIIIINIFNFAFVNRSTNIPLVVTSIFVCFAAITILIIFTIIMTKRTKYGISILGRIKGFKRFLETAEKEQLEKLVEDDPEYFYDILPYTYSLGVSNKWVKRFDGILVNEPNWFMGNDGFNFIIFNNFMNSTMSTLSNSAYSGGDVGGFGGSGGSSGGGFSGGGSGGSSIGSW